MPTPREMARTMRLRREARSTWATVLRPETNTFTNKNVVMPPMTQSGMAEMMPETLARMPKKMSQHPHATPALLDAHLVSAMTPLFCEKVVLGMPVPRAARKEQTPSERRPPWMDLSNSSDSTDSSEAS